MSSEWWIKDNWGKGPWHEEPDMYEFTYKGFKCDIIRNNLGIFCGYIFIPMPHEFSKLEGLEIPIEVHGGITFSEVIIMDDKEYLCIGFDCGHSGDLMPYTTSADYQKQMNKFEIKDLEFEDSLSPEKRKRYLEVKKMIKNRMIYKDIGFVIKQLQSMAEQIITHDKYSDSINALS